MLTAATRKSVRDLTGRPVRAVLSIATLAISVASISFLAVPTLIDDAMQDEVRAGHLADVTVWLQPIALGDDDLDALAALPNVAGVEAWTILDVRVLIGERRAPARVIGIRDFEDQHVDLARVESGSFPDEGEVLSDVQNANVGVYGGDAGDTITVVGETGETPLALSGRGRTLPGGEQVQDESVVVLYATVPTVASLGGDTGFGRLAFQLDDPGPLAAEETVELIRQQLGAVEGFEGFAGLPQVREPGDWPAKSDTEQFAKLLSVITVLALFSSVVLIANTMSTLVAEQTRQIAVMRAIGARRRDISAVYLRTTVLVGGSGALVGSALGVLLANALAASFGQQFWAVDVAFGVDWKVLLASLVLGVVAAPLAALPAIWRAQRLGVRQGLEATDMTMGAGRIDAVLRQATFLPRPAQIGLRNAGRRLRRSLAIAVIVALAVGNLLAVLAVSQGATEATQSSWGDHLEDVQFFTGGTRPFDDAAREAVASTPGVAEVEEVLKTGALLGSRRVVIWAVELDPLFGYRMSEGRWFDSVEADEARPVVVVERNLAEVEGIEVGDTIALTIETGVADFEVVGVAGNQQEDGMAVFVPLSTARSLLDQPEGTRLLWVQMTSSEEPFVDRTTSAVEDRLMALGHDVASEIRYVAESREISANRSITWTITVLGLMIVAISMVGLANTMTTNVLERTREIGILRSIGARGRDVRRIFTSEGVALAILGWVIGIPVGYALARLLVWLIWQVLEVRIPFLFPPLNLLGALAGTILLALLVLFFPVRRAVRFRPGEALRYE